jgi:prophage DNA circulation protein
MAWQDFLQPASYDGVPFGVLEVERESGRRAIIHEYPQRDRATVEDLGRQTRRHRIDGFVVGDDFLAQLEALEKVCERSPTGYPVKVGKVLVHPYFGQMLAHCESIRWRTGDRGRVASFVAQFIEVDEDFEPLAPIPNPEGSIDDAAAAAELEMGAAVTDGLEVSGIELVRIATSSALHGLGSTINGLQSFFRGPSSAIASVRFAATSLIANASSLATAPADLVSQTLAAIGSITDAVGSAAGSLSAYQALADRFERPLFGGSGSYTDVAQANADLVARLIAQSAAVWAARSAVRVRWRSYEDAVEGRDELLARLDALGLEASPPVFRELAKLAAVLVDAVPPIGEDLPRLETVTLAEETPALVLAYRLYDDVERAREVADRNGVDHPSFLPAAEPLEVLSE